MRRDTTTALLPNSRAVIVSHATPGTRCPDGSPHHIVLETPHGTAMVAGACKKCGYTKDYRAGEEYGGFIDNDFSLGAASPVRGGWAI